MTEVAERQKVRFDQWWLPPGETHLTEWMTKVNRRVDGRLSYQYHKYEAALALCKTREVAVDVGAHCGLLSHWMARDFKTVHAFEPVQEHQECFALNITSGNVLLHGCALGERRGRVAIRTEPTSSGDSRVAGEGDIPMRRLDEFRLHDVSFIKLDCEGFELFALKGGEQTIRRSMPVVMVEQKKGRAQKFGLAEQGAVEWLATLGYRMAKELSGDFICVPR